MPVPDKYREGLGPDKVDDGYHMPQESDKPIDSKASDFDERGNFSDVKPEDREEFSGVL